MPLGFFRQHPTGVFVCFATEVWERFSYYGMRALLVFFLTQHFLFGDSKSYLIYGAYVALAFMTPVLGGAIADRYLGSRKSVTLGAVLLVMGHFGMAIEGPPATEALVGGVLTVQRDTFYLQAFYLSLALIITGVGFLKNSISTVVGALYARGDPRRDAGFTIFYMGINIGAGVAPVLCGWLGQTYGWRYGFGLAGVGMLAGLVVFLRGQRHLLGHAEPPNAAYLREKVLFGLSRETLIYIGALLPVLAIWWIIQHQEVVASLLAGVGVLTGSVILYFAFARCTRAERDQLLVCAVLIVFTVAFWAIYEQLGSSLNLFADRMVNRRVFGYEIPASMLQALPSLFVIPLAPLFGGLWIWLDKRGREPSTPVKFSMAIGLLSVAFFLFALATRIGHATGQIALAWCVAAFLLFAMGELLLAPVAMSMVTKLAPKRIVGLMMGSFLLAYSGASFIAGLLARLTSAQTVHGAVVDRGAAFDRYASVYLALGITALGVALLLLLLSPWLRRGMHETRAVLFGASVAPGALEGKVVGGATL